MNGVALVAPRLARLIPRLGSDHDGEVVATARAIVRTLTSAGLDLHDLSKLLDGAQAEPETPPRSWEDLATWCQRNDYGRLKPHERNFVADMAIRLPLGLEPTERQAQWLAAIYARLRRAS
jgi:hypothetical protein